VRDFVHESCEHANETGVLSASVTNRPDRDGEPPVSRIHLDRYVVGAARIERAQDRELKVVRALEREVGATSDAAQHERRNASEPCVGRNREDDAVAVRHGRRCRHEMGVRDHLDSVGVATSSDFDVRTEALPGDADAVFVTGELDLATAPRLKEALAALTGDVVVVDLSGCTFLDSAGIRALVDTARTLAEADRDLRVVTSDAGILRLLEITGVDTLIGVHPSLDDAL
jgi:anti-sigma B factor antagonist